MSNFNLNKMMLGGRLTSDVELRQTPKGDSVVSGQHCGEPKGKECGRDLYDRFLFVYCLAASGGVYKHVFQEGLLDPSDRRDAEPLLDGQAGYKAHRVRSCRERGVLRGR